MDDCFARLDACGAEPDLVALCKQCLAPRMENPKSRNALRSDFARVDCSRAGGTAAAGHLGFVGSRLGYAIAVSTTLTPVLIILILLLSPLILRGENE